MTQNLYGDLLKIAGGDVAVAQERVTQFRDFANHVSGGSQPNGGAARSDAYSHTARTGGSKPQG